MPVKNYQKIEHTADIGIRVKAASLKELFREVALSIFDIMAEKKLPAANCQLPAEKFTVRQKAENLEELFINWLNELISLSCAKEVIFSDFKIIKISQTAIEALALANPIKDYQILKEIKAATYHRLKLLRIKSGWQAEIILDV
jgi:SHS2 domain-containing protein